MRLFELEDKLDYLFIKEHCGKSLRAMKLTMKCLFRGVSNVESQMKPMFIGSNQNNRSPTHSSIPGQKQFDEYLMKLNIKALRSNSIFATSNLDMARSYGIAYAVFPFDNCSFAWSRNTRDQVIYPEDMKKFRTSVFDKNDTMKDELKRFQDYYAIDDSDFQGALRSGHALWFTGKYAAIEWKKNQEAIDELIYSH